MQTGKVKKVPDDALNERLRSINFPPIGKLLAAASVQKVPMASSLAAFYNGVSCMIFIRRGSQWNLTFIGAMPEDYFERLRSN